MSTTHEHARPSRLPRRTGEGVGASKQRGVVLFIALIALVAMTLAGIALVRSVDTSILIAGNLAFKQGVTALSDTGIEAGRTWLIANANTAVLNDDSPNNGYYATDQVSLDLINNVDWDGTNSGAASKASILAQSSLPSAMQNKGYVVSYIIHRLCQNNGVLVSGTCGTYQESASSGSTKGGGGVKPISGVLKGYYRVTARVSGPKNTVGFVQAIIRL